MTLENMGKTKITGIEKHWHFMCVLKKAKS